MLSAGKMAACFTLAAVTTRAGVFRNVLRQNDYDGRLEEITAELRICERIV